MITDYIEMTESRTPLLMTEKLNLSVTVVDQFRKDPGEVKMHVGLVWAPSTGQPAAIYESRAFVIRSSLVYYIPHFFGNLKMVGSQKIGVSIMNS